MRFLADAIFLLLFFVVAICWLVAWLAFHVAGGAVHLLLVLALIFLILHLFQGRRAA